MKALTTINPKEKIGSKLDKNENKLYIPSKYSKFFQEKFNQDKPKSVYSVYFNNFQHIITTYA
jgi:hypothetical protein